MSVRIQLFYNCNNETVHYNCNTTILLGRELQTPTFPELYKMLKKNFETPFETPVFISNEAINEFISCVADLFYSKSIQRTICHPQGTTRSLQGHSRALRHLGIRRALGHSGTHSTWHLVLEYLRQLGTQRAL